MARSPSWLIPIVRLHSTRITIQILNMNMATVVIPLIYVALVAGVIYVLKQLGQLVRAQERVAGALETIARKLEGGGKP